MRCARLLLLPLLLCAEMEAQQGTPGAGQNTQVQAASAPVPDPVQLLHDVERNEERMDALRRDYTYHVHLVQQRLRKDGSVKETEVTDAESLTLEGVRVDRTVARNGKPLDAAEQAKENSRVDKEVARAQERRAKAEAAGQKTDPRGDAIITVARLLELGNFQNERRVLLEGRPTLVLDYTGDPRAKTRSAAEAVVKDIAGTVWIDEADRVLVRAEGHFMSDYKVGGGLIADVRKDSHFDFAARHINDDVWLPAVIHGEGTVRILMVAGFAGRLELTTSDYRRFQTSVHIVPGPASDGRKTEPGASSSGQSSGPPKAEEPQP